MPYTNDNGRISLSGNLLTWFKDIPAWFQQDTGVDFNSITPEAQLLYLALVGLTYGMKLQEKWGSEWFGKGKEKSKTLNDMYGKTNGKFDASKTDGLKVLDFIAENSDEQFRQQHATESRKFASQIINGLIKGQGQTA